MDDRDVEGGSEKLQFLSRAEIEERVQTRTSELQNVMGAMADILIRLDDRGSITMASGALETVLGYDPEELEGKPVDILLAEPPSDSQSAVSSIDQLLERLIRDGQVTDIEVYCSRVDGETVPMSLSASTLEGENGVPTGIVCVAKDITERKEAEKQAEFLHSLLRHDLGNRLQAASGFLELVTERDLDPEVADYVGRSLDALYDIDELIHSVRKLKRIDDSTPLEPTNLEVTITSAVESYETLRAEQGVTIDTDLDAVTVLAGPLLIELFTNLIENSLSHSNADLLRISTDVDPETVTVRVEDDGTGIPAEKRDVIFERGYSTGSSANSGLGMYIVRKLVESYDGEITVGESATGGARFDVTLQRGPD
ncbi:sensor histidine kinase [Halobacteriaceae archaeon SHR40]|uniref:ATP-binding protein n=1 Tax=Halovenus amylolytica TaxID=2500550 RepID=UPI000FE36CDB